MTEFGWRVFRILKRFIPFIIKIRNEEILSQVQMIDMHAFTIILFFTIYILLKNELFTCKTN